MVTVESNSAHDIEIRSVVIESERFNGRTFDIYRNVIEINIFEHIDLPFITGTILIVDSSNIFNMINFQGTERVTVKLKIGGDPTARLVVKKFVVTNISGTVPASDTAEVMTLNVIEEHAYLDRLKSVSKAYRGKPEDIIEKIAFDQLRKKVSTPAGWAGSTQSQMQVVVPNWSTLDTIRWIKNRATSANGMPFFVYSTLHDDSLIMTDLEEILTAPVRRDRSYVYGQAFTRATTESTVLEQAYIIQAYKSVRSEDMHELAMNGSLNSSYSFVDTSRSQTETDYSVVTSMEDIIKMMVSKNILQRNQQGKIYDDEFVIGDKKLSEHTPTRVSQITTSNTFTNFANYFESDDIAQHRLKVIAHSVRRYLLKSPIDVSLPGFNFLGRRQNNTIGSQLRMKFLKNDQNLHQESSVSALDVIDKKRSGDYLVYACRHVMKPERYDVSMTCVKLANLDRTYA